MRAQFCFFKWTVVGGLLLLAGCGTSLPERSATLGPSPNADLGVAKQRLADLPIEEGRLVLPVLQDAEEAGELAQLARSLWRGGGEKEALGLLLDGLRRNGLDADGLSLLAALAEHEGYPEPALAARRSALDLESSAERRRQLAAFLSRLGRHAEAVAAWEHVLAVEPSAANRGRLAVARHLAGLSVDPSLAADAPLPLQAQLSGGEPLQARLHTASPEVVRSMVGPEVRIDTGGTTEAAELSMVAWQDQLTVAWNDLRDAVSEAGEWRIGVGRSSDGGQTWVDQLLRPLDPQPNTFEGDPMTAVDPRTGHRWVGGIEFGGGGSVYVAHQHPDGSLDPPVELYQGPTDKCWMGAGPAPGNPASTRVYVAYNFPNSLHRTTNLGTTWSAPVPIDEDGIGFLPRVTPDGTLRLGYTDFTDFVFQPGIVLQVSTDGGVSVGSPSQVVERMDIWDVSDNSRFPGQFRVAPLPILATASNEVLYFVYMDTTATRGSNADVDLYFIRSADGGTTWSTPTIVAGGPAVEGDQLLPWLEVDADGRLHLAYFDTRHTPQNDTDADAWLDVYYATSGDGGQSWTELRLTEAPFNTAGINWPGLGQFIGDYLAVAVSEEGVWVAYPRVDETGSDLDLFVRRVEPFLFRDGFESGNTGAWD